MSKLRCAKAKKEYICFMCDKLINKDTLYYDRPYATMELVDLFRDVTGCSHLSMNEYETYVKINLCSWKCVKAFNKWKIIKNSYPTRQIKKFNKLVQEAYERRKDNWIRFANENFYASTPCPNCSKKYLLITGEFGSKHKVEKIYECFNCNFKFKTEDEL